MLKALKLIGGALGFLLAKRNLAFLFTTKMGYITIVAFVLLIIGYPYPRFDFPPIGAVTPGLLFRVPYVYLTGGGGIIKIDDKDHKINPETKKDQYLIFAHDTKTQEELEFKIEDCWWHGQDMSSKLWGHIKRDKEYKQKHYGWRFGKGSWYPNLYHAELIKTDGE